jgi:hypothetical protein
MQDSTNKQVEKEAFFDALTTFLSLPAITLNCRRIDPRLRRCGRRLPQCWATIRARLPAVPVRLAVRGDRGSTHLRVPQNSPSN